MPLSFTDDLVGIDWEELSALYRIAPLGDKSAPDLKSVFTNSMHRLFAHDAGALVGAGRVLADGRDCAYLCDIAVHPDYHGKGLGKDIVGRLVRLSASHKKIILYAVAGKEGFYERFGFRRMTTAMAISRIPPRPLPAAKSSVPDGAWKSLRKAKPMQQNRAFHRHQLHLIC
jgi:ribosomal protein S18 acetylase RimI-like enzyme